MMVIREAKFKQDGVLNYNGEVVAEYKAGDTVAIILEQSPTLYKVQILDGKSSNRTANIQKDELELTGRTL